MSRVIASRYALEAEIGRGGMGTVWRATDQVLGRTVALKRIGFAPGGAAGFTPDALRAEREARLAAKLSHANVVSVFDLASEETPEGTQQWLVMEYVDGIDLSAMVKERGALTPDELAPVLAQVAAALAAAHGAGIVHRDVKPSNILSTASGQVKLSDFGIARTASDPSLTQTGLVTGSPAYLSPEVASGQSATPSSDVWSWGATMFHGLEGRPPYDVGENLLGALYRIVHEEPPRPRSAGWLTPVLEGTMTRDPAQRWAIRDVQAFLEDGAGRSRPLPVAARTRSADGPPAAGTTLMPLASDPRSTAESPVQPPPADPPVRSPRARQPWALLALLGVLVLAAVVVAFWVGLRGGDEPTAGSTDPSSAPPTASESSSAPSPSPSAATPDEAGMREFVSAYVTAATDDPASGFAMLTPQFQEASNGYTGYLGFWGTVLSSRLLDVSADPASLQVTYTYRYRVEGSGQRTETVSLQLAFDNGTYLVAGNA